MMLKARRVNGEKSASESEIITPCSSWGTHTPPFYIFNSLWADLVQKCEFTSPSHPLSNIFKLFEEAKLHEEKPRRHRKNMQTHRKALTIFLQFSTNFRNSCTTPCTNLLLLNTINLPRGLKDKLNNISDQNFKAKLNFFLDGFLTIKVTPVQIPWAWMVLYVAPRGAEYLFSVYLKSWP